MCARSQERSAWSSRTSGLSTRCNIIIIIIMRTVLYPIVAAALIVALARGIHSATQDKEVVGFAGRLQGVERRMNTWSVGSRAMLLVVSKR